jgi:hypothetical protein
LTTAFDKMRVVNGTVASTLAKGMLFPELASTLAKGALLLPSLVLYLASDWRQKVNYSSLTPSMEFLKIIMV